MNKRLIIPVIALVIVLASAWIVIPQKIKVTSSVTYPANSQGVFNFLTRPVNWKNWWPGTSSGDSNLVLNYSDYDFFLTTPLYHAYQISFKKNRHTDTALLRIIPLSVDSAGLELTTKIDAGMDPVSRITKYFQARKIKKIFDNIVNSLAQYTRTVKNVYDFDIRNEKVQMQYLLSASKTLPRYPSTYDIYSLIEKIRSYLKTTDGKEEFHPMLNIEKTDSTNYLIRVGLPVNKTLPGTKEISVKQMVKNGNILVAEVTGDRKMIEHALNQMEKYIADHQRSIIAIPFQSLETDRRAVTDSTKWVTKIFYPVV